MSYKDRKVLELVMENKDFQKNIEKSIESLNILNKATEDFTKNKIFKELDDSLDKMSENISKSLEEIKKSINDLSNVTGAENLARNINKTADEIGDSSSDISDSVKEMSGDVSKSFEGTENTFADFGRNVGKTLDNTRNTVSDTTDDIVDSQNDIVESTKGTDKAFETVSSAINESMQHAGNAVWGLSECLETTSKIIEQSTPTAMAAIDTVNTYVSNMGGTAESATARVSAAFSAMSTVVPTMEIDNSLKIVENRFSAFNEFVRGLILKLASDVYSEIQKIINKTSTLTTQQIPAGFNKYESKLKSVQTIMAATGLSIEDVETELERLNWYTDETSANYSDMAANISKFTSVNIPLEEATEAMMGIANWAFVSGADMQQASRAMYNISQAMGTGVMMTRDWMSIENANMATSQFKQTVIDTAKELYKAGKLDSDVIADLDVTVESFRESLSEGWFTKDIMMQSFKYYSEYSNEVKRIQENAASFSDEILQKYHYFTQATDVIEYLDNIKAEGMKDLAAPFDEFQKKAKEYGISIADTIAILNTSTEDELKKKAETLGITLEKATKIKGDTGFSSLTEKAKELGLSLDYITELASGSTFLELSEKAFKAGQEYKTFGDVIDATADAVSTKWMNVFQTIFGNFEEAKEIWSALGGVFYDIFATPVDNILSIVEVWRELEGREILIEAISNAWEGLLQVLEPIKEAFLEIFPIFGNFDILAIRLRKLTVDLREFTKGLSLSAEQSEKVQAIFTNVFKTLDGIRIVAGALFKSGLRILEAILPKGSTIYDILFGISEKGSELSDGAEQFANKITAVTDIVVEKIAEIKSFLFDIYSPENADGFKMAGYHGYIDYLWQKIKTFAENVKAVFESMRAFISNISMGDFSQITGVFQQVSERVSGYIETIKSTFASGVVNLPNLLTNWGALIENLKNKFSVIFGVVIENLPIILDYLKQFDFSNLITFLGGAFAAKGAKNIVDFFNNLKSTFSNYDFFKKAVENFESSLNKLTGTFNMFGSMIRERLGLPKLKTFITAIGVIAATILALTVSLILLAGVDTKKLFITFGVITASLGVITGIILLLNQMTKTTSSVSRIRDMFAGSSNRTDSRSNEAAILNIAILFGSIAASLLVLSAAIKLLGTMDTGAMIQGLLGVVTILAAVSLFMQEMNKLFAVQTVTTGNVASEHSQSLTTGQFIGIAVFINMLAAAVMAMTVPIMAMSILDPLKLIQGVGAFAVILLAIVTTIKEINKIFGKSKDDAGNVDNLSMSAGKLLAAALAIDMIAAAVVAISIPIIAMSSADPIGLMAAVAVFGIICVGIYTLIDKINSIFRKTDAGNDLSMSAGKLLAAALAIDMIAGAIVAMMVPIMAMSFMSTEGLIKGIVGFSVICVAIWTMLEKINNIFKSYKVSSSDLSGTNTTTHNDSSPAGKLLAAALAIDMIAGAIVALMIPVLAIGQLNNDALLRGLGGFAVLCVSIWTLLEKINDIFKSYTVSDDRGTSTHNNSMSAGKLLAAALAIDMMAGAVLVMSVPVMAIGQLSNSGFLKGIGGFLIVIVGISLLFQKIDSVKDISAGKILAMALAMDMIAGAMLVMMVPVLAFGKMDDGAWLKGFGGMTAVLVGLFGFISLTELLKPKISTLLTISAAMIMLSGALTLMVIPIKTLGMMDFDQLKQGIIATVGVLTVFALLLTGADLIKINIASVLGLAISIAVMAVAINLLVAPIQAIGNMDTGSMIQGLLGMFAVLLMIAVFTKIMEGGSGVGAATMLGVAGSLVVMAAAIAVLALVITFLGKQDFDVLAKGIGSLVIVLVLLIAAGYLAEGAAIGLIALAGSVLAIAASILLIVAAIYLMVQLTPEQLGEWLMAWSDFFDYLGEQIGNWLSDRFDDFKEGWRIIGSFFSDIFDSWKKGWSTICDWFKGLGDAIKSMWTDHIEPAMVFIGGAIVQVGTDWKDHWEKKGEEVYDGLTKLGEDIKGFNQQLIDDLTNKLTPFFDWIKERIDDWKKGWKEIVDWGKGVEEGAKNGWDNFWANWQSGVDDTSYFFFGKQTDEEMAKWREEQFGDGYSLGTSYGEGYGEGINNSTGSATNAATSMVNSTLGATAAAQDSHSPSEESKKLGNDYGLGYGEGISESSTSAIESSVSMVTEVIDATKEAFANADLKGAGDKAVQVFLGNLMNGMDVKTAFERAFAEFDGKVDLSKAKALLNKITDGGLVDGLVGGMTDSMTKQMTDTMGGFGENMAGSMTDGFSNQLGDQFGTGFADGITNGITNGTDLTDFQNGLITNTNMSDMSTAGEKYGYDFGSGFTTGEKDALNKDSKSVQKAVEQPYKSADTFVQNKDTQSNLIWRGYGRNGEELWAPSKEDMYNNLVKPIRDGFEWHGWDAEGATPWKAVETAADAMKDAADQTALAEKQIITDTNKQKWMLDENAGKWVAIDENGNPITKTNMEGKEELWTQDIQKPDTKVQNGLWIWDEKNKQWIFTINGDMTPDEKGMLLTDAKAGINGTPTLSDAQYASILKKQAAQEQKDKEMYAKFYGDLAPNEKIREFKDKDGKLMYYGGKKYTVKNKETGETKTKQDKYALRGRKLAGYDNAYALVDENGNLIFNDKGERITFTVDKTNGVKLMTESMTQAANTMNEAGKEVQNAAKNPNTKAAMYGASTAVGNAEATKDVYSTAVVHNQDTGLVESKYNNNVVAQNQNAQQQAQDATQSAKSAIDHLQEINSKMTEVRDLMISNNMMLATIEALNMNMDKSMKDASARPFEVNIDGKKVAEATKGFMNKSLGVVSRLGGRQVAT